MPSFYHLGIGSESTNTPSDHISNQFKPSLLNYHHLSYDLDPTEQFIFPNTIPSNHIHPFLIFPLSKSTPVPPCPNNIIQLNRPFQMADFQLDISDIRDQQTALTISTIFLQSALQNNTLRKDFVQNFFTNAQNNLENQSISPITKFYTLFILKEISTKDKITLKIFGTFSQHPLYNYLEETAINIDPKKQLSEKGKSLFPGDKQTGNNYMRLLLESLVTWGTKFPTNSKKEPTRFKKTLTRLQSEKVILPKEFQYYPANTKKTERSETPQERKEEIKGPSVGSISKDISNPNISGTPGGPKLPKEKLVGQIKFMYNKIQTLLGILQDSESLQEIQREVKSYHLKFQKDHQKLQEIQMEVLEMTDEELMKLYFKINEFFNEEKTLYEQNAMRNEYDIYVNGYSIAFEKIFQDGQKVESKPQKVEPSIEKKISESKVKNSLPPPKPSAVRSDKYDTNQERVSEKENMKKPSQKESTSNIGRPIKDSVVIGEHKNVIDSCFNKLENRSKSPIGFGSIAKSLEKEKKGAVGSRLKVSNANLLNKSKFAMGSSLSKSMAKLKGIFASPPNPHVKPKSYQGQLVLENQQLERQCERLTKEQGTRRLKTSLFRNKSLLYQDDAIQIGFKSSPVYEKVDKFTSMLDFELYFGNKTSSNISRFQVHFQGDKQSLIYTNPQVVENFIPAGTQVKLELLNIPKSMPFGLVSIQATFEHMGETRHLLALLPNSILQLAVYFQLGQQDLQKIWDDSPKILKTQPFKLSHHFPPDELTRFIPTLKSRGSYSKFCEQGNSSDFELFCEVVLQQKYEGLLKIIIRPDLTVILQAALHETSDDCLYNFKFYLQSLRMALREIDG